MAEKKNKGGRPPKFACVEDMQSKIDEYFANPKFETLEDVPTMSGLAFELGIDRKTLLNYSEKEKFIPTIKRAKANVEKHIERLSLLKGNTCTIFNLKNNFGWEDKSQQDSNITIQTSWESNE